MVCQGLNGLSGSSWSVRVLMVCQGLHGLHQGLHGLAGSNWSAFGLAQNSACSFNFDY